MELFDTRVRSRRDQATGEDLIALLSEGLEKEEEVLFAYLFGSMATDKAGPNSDIDIAVYLKNDSLDTQLRLITGLSKLTGGEVDLLILNRVKNLYLLDEIFRSNHLLKDHDLRIDFEVRKEHEILDFKAHKRRIYAA